MRILVGGVGNIFLGDDAFGSEVARRLLNRELPRQVRVIDFGIRGFDLAFALMDGYDATILIDAAPRGGRPGTLYTIEPDLSELDGLNGQEVRVDTHGMNPVKVLAMARSMGVEFRRILVVGCEPETLGPEGEGQLGMSATVARSVDEAVSLVEALVSDLISSDDECRTLQYSEDGEQKL